MTRSSGATAAASSSSACTASNRSARSRHSPSTRPEAAAPSVGDQHAAAGLEPGQGGVRVGDALDDLGQLGLEPAEHLGEREVGQRAVAEVEAVPGDDAPALGDREVAQLGEQPGLADAGVAGEHARARLAGRPSRRAADDRTPSNEAISVSSASRPTRVRLVVCTATPSMIPCSVVCSCTVLLVRRRVDAHPSSTCGGGQRAVRVASAGRRTNGIRTRRRLRPTSLRIRLLRYSISAW